MRLNTPVERAPVRTHEGGRADAHQKPVVELERAVATCLLFENTFYESGKDLAARIAELCKAVPVEQIAALAIKARNHYKLRHVPLFLCRQLARLASGRKDGLVRHTIASVIQRPDEMGEFVAQYWKPKKEPLSGQAKKGLRQAFGQFTDYQLKKWNREAAIQLRDVMFLVKPKPSESQAALYKQIADKDKSIESADTWEVALTAGADKKETWERLLSEKKLGYMALLQNLRNMTEVHVKRGLVETAILAGASHSKALPFRFVSAAKHAPGYAQVLSDAMITSLTEAPRLNGMTVLLIDVSGSMDGRLSDKSDLVRLEAAGALAVLLRETAKVCRVFTFSDSLIEVSNVRGLGLVDAISQSQPHGGTFLAGALKTLQQVVPSADRVIVVTDEQSADGNGKNWTKYGYICNVAPYKPGLEVNGGWTRINGWSERVIDWMRAEETLREAE